MKTIRTYTSVVAFCLLFFVLTLPCSAQEAAGVDEKAGTAQRADSSSGGQANIKQLIIQQMMNFPMMRKIAAQNRYSR